MSLYVPNIGEKEMLRAILGNMELNLGLMANSPSIDGGSGIDLITELNTGGGRAYATKVLQGAIVESALTAAKWFLHTNSAGAAQGEYAAAAQQWVMAQADVDDGATIYGAFGYMWALPFDGGVTEIKPGDKIKGATSAATATVAMVTLTSGTWGTTAAGVMWLRSKTGTFQDNENLIINGCAYTIAVGSAGGGSYAVGDIVTLTQTGGAGAKAVVSSVNAGAVTGLVLVDGGQGYSVANGLATAHVSGSGNDALTVNISAVSTVAVAVSNSGTTNAGDAHKRLIFVDTFTTSYAVDTVGMSIEYTPKITLASA